MGWQSVGCHGWSTIAQNWWMTQLFTVLHLGKHCGGNSFTWKFHSQMSSCSLWVQFLPPKKTYADVCIQYGHPSVYKTVTKVGTLTGRKARSGGPANRGWPSGIGTRREHNSGACDQKTIRLSKTSRKMALIHGEKAISHKKMSYSKEYLFWIFPFVCRIPHGLKMIWKISLGPFKIRQIKLDNKRSIYFLWTSGLFLQSSTHNEYRRKLSITFVGPSTLQMHNRITAH